MLYRNNTKILRTSSVPVPEAIMGINGGTWFECGGEYDLNIETSNEVHVGIFWMLGNERFSIFGRLATSKKYW